MTTDADVLARVRGRLAIDAVAPSAARVAALVREEGGLRGAADVLDVVESVRRELVGAGPLDELLHEPGVTDVLVNGPHEVWVDRGTGLELSRTSVRRRERLAAPCGSAGRGGGPSPRRRGAMR